MVIAKILQELFGNFRFSQEYGTPKIELKEIQEQVHFLGHVISQSDIKTEPAKINDVVVEQTLKNKHDIRSSLGL